VGHELSVALMEVVVAAAVTWAVSLVLETWTGADAEVTVCVAVTDEVWLAVAVLVVAADVLDGDAINVVVTTRFVVGIKFCVVVATTVMVEGTPIRSFFSMLW
jgi:hypothetical protein